MVLTVRNRFQSVLGTYYCAAFLVYSATFLTFFWELRSLLLRFSLPDIAGYFSYQLAFALIESVIVALSVVALVHLLPIRQVRANPAVVGGLFVLSLAIISILFRTGADIVQWMHSSLPLTQASALQVMTFLWLFTILVLPILSIVIVRTERITNRLRIVIENLSVLAVLYTALGVIGILIVIFRNLA